MAESRISFEVQVTLMSFISALVPSFSDTRILVPSDRTTRSRGEIKKANGKLWYVWLVCVTDGRVEFRNGKRFAALILATVKGMRGRTLDTR